MIRFRSLIPVCACILATVGCNGGNDIGGPGPSGPPLVSVELRGRVVDADGEGPVGNLLVSLSTLSVPSSVRSSGSNTHTARTGADGTFSLSLKLPPEWKGASVKVAGPGYDDAFWGFVPDTVGTPAAIRVYPTLVIRPGDSIAVRVEFRTSRCAFGGVFDCRRVVVDASPGDPVELEIVPHDAGNLMGLTASIWDEEPVPSLLIAPGANAYVYGSGTATLRARR